MAEIKKPRKRYKHEEFLLITKFGKLKVIELTYNSPKSKLRNPWRAICDCDCGKSNLDISPSSLIRGLTTSCGCCKERYKKITGENSVLYSGYKGISGKYWNMIKLRANRRGYDFNISIEDAWNLFEKQNQRCALSNQPISFAISSRKSSTTSASLDRIDSNIGYLLNNIQWVHKDVNLMKNVFDQKYFIDLCKKIALANET